MIRVKMLCRSYVTVPPSPAAETRYDYSNGDDTWPRHYHFIAVYDDGQDYAIGTPTCVLTLHVDNPAHVYEPGQLYWLSLAAE